MTKPDTKEDIKKSMTPKVKREIEKQVAIVEELKKRRK